MKPAAIKSAVIKLLIIKTAVVKDTIFQVYFKTKIICVIKRKPHQFAVNESQILKPCSHKLAVAEIARDKFTIRKVAKGY